jgi:hypothetical protein
MQSAISAKGLVVFLLQKFFDILPFDEPFYLIEKNIGMLFLLYEIVGKPVTVTLSLIDYLLGVE